MKKRFHGERTVEDLLEGRIYVTPQTSSIRVPLPWRPSDVEAQFTDSPRPRPACEISGYDRLTVRIGESCDGCHFSYFLDLEIEASSARTIEWRALKF